MRQKQQQKKQKKVAMVNTALLLIDMQNDFLHPDGAYGRAGVTSAELAALPERLVPLVQQVRAAGGWVIATLFTLVPGRDGAPLIADHLHALRPFLSNGDFAPGSHGQALLDRLQPADFSIEKIAYSAFYMTRLEWLLRRVGISRLIIAGIVTNGGVASTVRDAQVRDFHIELLADGCAAHDPTVHVTHIDALRGIATIRDCQSVLAELA